MIIFENVTVRLGGRRVLSAIDWHIAQGQNWAVWGANGAGKTCLAKTLLGETAVVGGNVRRVAAPSSSGAGRRPAVALISPEQYHHLHARERIRAEMRGFSGRGAETRAGELLPTTADEAFAKRRRRINALFDLAPLAAKPVTALSSGELRRVLLGRALLNHPRLLVLDEPFNGLDSAARAALRQALEQLAPDDTQIVLITHRLSEIPDNCTHVLHLDQGRVVWQGRRDMFVRHLARQAEGDPAPAPVAPRPPGVDLPAATGRPLVVMRNVKVRYRDTVVLDGIDWTLRAGEQWALIGPNGAGKTTLLKLISGEQLQSYANDIELFGRPKGSGESLQEIRDAIGLVDDGLQARYQHAVTGREVVCSGFFDSVGLYRRCTPDQVQLAERWLNRLEVEHLADLRFARLSFGEQRLLLITRAMVKSPQLLILDEPCNGLDSRHRRQVLALLERIAGDGHTSLLYTSHRADELPACLTHLLYLEKGRIVRQVVRSPMGP